MTTQLNNLNNEEAWIIADTVNDAYASHLQVKVNGREVTKHYFSQPASVCANGTVEVHVKARNGQPHSVSSVWIKKGTACWIDIHDQQGFAYDAN